MPTLVREVKAVDRYVLDPVRFSALTVPVRVLMGTESAAHLKASAAATQAALPHSDIVELPGQGHAAMDTAPQLFLDEVIRFFT